MEDNEMVEIKKDSAGYYIYNEKEELYIQIGNVATVLIMFKPPNYYFDIKSEKITNKDYYEMIKRIFKSNIGNLKKAPKDYVKYFGVQQ
jgi:hypothetical protein